ncbi:SRPBCC family protein [Candidatus Solirubrobacter pratensis]|uniref:SRPBCC family protein n=1 Tax=Candidatus Solirubrobacter pratensis TaxID=1298857 RepID=UPI0003FDB907|nr:SRPBCC family protein [Candidatus Solirubrobacter pratensis]
MAEITKQAARRGKNVTEQADGARGEEEAPDMTEDSESNRTITSELRDTFREAAIEVLKPVMRKATTSAAKYAVTQGPGLVKDKVAPRVQEAGGAAALAKGVASKGGGVAEMVGGVASGLGGKFGGKKKEGESPSGTGRGRRLPVEEFIDIGADLETVYDQFTQFEEWPKFMHRVERIEQRDDTTLMWHENIWSVRRSWEAEITDQEPCVRIAWRSKGGPQTVGVVSFHRLSEHLTRICMTVDFQPKGLFEKTASGMRISRRAIKSDLMRFKAFIELRDEATGEWRGRIEEGELVEEEEGREDEEPRAAEDEEMEEDEEPVASEDEEEEEEPVASEDEDEYEEDEEEEEEEEEEEPAASGKRGRFARDEEEAEEEEPEEEAPKPRRRRRSTAPPSRGAS